MKSALAAKYAMHLFRTGMGLFLLVVGVLKIGQVADTATFITRSDILPAWCSTPLACTGIAMELVVSVCLVLRYKYLAAAAWGSVMCAVYLFFYAQGWARGLELSCNCLGVQHEIVDYPADTALRVLLLAGMLLLVWDARRAGRPL
ncbi:MAG: hypothetical protein Q4F30_05535 [Akkermansia sp.]|nr:hypothetical protein [Akkermansia sp.]